MEEKLTSQWVAARCNLFLRQRAARDRTGATSCSNSAVTVLISYARVPNWKPSRHGVDRSFLALLTIWSSRLQIKSKNVASNRLLRTWCGGPFSYFNIKPGDICYLLILA